MFGTTRIPKHGMDCLELHPKSRHFIVMRAHRFYRVELLDRQGLP